MAIFDELGLADHARLAGVLMAVILAVGLMGTLSGPQWRDLTSGEEGAAYSLGYVLTFPIFLLFMCMVIEVALLCMVKLGTVYAAYAAARSYAVWLPFPDGLADQKARQAARQAMAAFASSNPRHASALGGSSSTSDQGFAAAFQSYAQGVAAQPSASYVPKKRRFAEAATDVTLDSSPSQWNGDVQVTVRYQMPYHIAVVGKILGGHNHGGVYFRLIESKATIQVEGVKGKNIGSQNPLGIRYDPGEL